MNNPLRKWLKNSPIQKKLLYSNLLGTTLAFIPVILITVVYEFFALRTHMLEEIRVQAAIVAESSSAAMAFRDEEAVQETLLALHGAPDIIKAYLVLPDCTVLGSYRSEGKTSAGVEYLEPSASHLEILTLSDITIRKPVFLQSEFVGTLFIVSSLKGFYTRLMWYAIIIVNTAAIGFLLARWVAAHISRTITDPLTSLINTTQKIMSEGDYSAPIPVETRDEVGSLSRAFSEMMSQVRKRDETLQQLAYFDRVTGIPNRHFFEETIARAVENARRRRTTCYLMMIDLDDFKIVNDTLGHHIGDMLLRHVSKHLGNVLRQDDAMFRIGGDEFAIIIESATDLKAVEQIAQRIIEAVSTPAMLDGNEVKVGASIGISSFPISSYDVSTLMSTADSAMYIAKAWGKNSYQTYCDKQTN